MFSSFVKIKVFCLAVLTGLSFLACMAPAAKAAPCSEMKVPSPAPAVNYTEGLEFTMTGEYKREFANAIKKAKAFCIKYKRAHPEEKNLAIVSDIDETLLDNREQFRKMVKPNWDEFNAWVNESRAPLLQETFLFLKWARQERFAIFLVTGRPESDRLATIVNLVRDGVSYDGLYLRDHHGGPPAEEFKTGVRAQIENMGFKIVTSIGDQFSDLVGGHCIDCVKLPNRMYFIK